MKQRAIAALTLSLLGCTGAPQPSSRPDVVASVDGTRIHYLERLPAAAASQPTIVFVPGWMMPADIWSRQIDHFGASRRAIAVDPRSQGASDKPAEGNYPAMRAQDLRAVLERLNLDHAVLVGASSGVTDIAAYVDQFGTDRIAALVLVHGVPGADYDPKRTPGLIQWAQGFQIDRKPRTEALVRSLFAKPPPEPLVQELTQKALEMPTNSAIAAFFGALASDYRPALAKIDKPTLILTAKNAWMEHYEAMQRQIAGAEIEAWEGVGHALYLDAPERFNARVDEFLRRVPPK
jgi:microsomal epoxide hydrolase